jgi:hypothetical protein
MTRLTRLGAVCGILAVWLATGVVAPAHGGSDGEQKRHIWDTSLIEPAGKKPARRARTARRYRVATPAVQPVAVADDTVLGVTVWRLRKARSTDRGMRILIQDTTSTGEWLPERVSTDTPLREGDRVRLTLEAARTGYLYVVDREVYADGTKSAPYLVFPTTRARGGNNEVAAGRVTEIPSQDDAIPVFTLRRSRADQVGEQLSVIVTTEPIPGIEIGPDPLRLSEADVQTWEKAWGTQVGRLELDGGAGEAWTAAEKAAGASGSAPLAPDAPRPQAIFFRPNSKTGDGLFASVALKYQGARTR